MVPTTRWRLKVAARKTFRSTGTGGQCDSIRLKESTIRGPSWILFSRPANWETQDKGSRRGGIHGRGWRKHRPPSAGRWTNPHHAIITKVLPAIFGPATSHRDTAIAGSRVCFTKAVARDRPAKGGKGASMGNMDMYNCSRRRRRPVSSPHARGGRAWHPRSGASPDGTIGSTGMYNGWRMEKTSGSTR